MRIPVGVVREEMVLNIDAPVTLLDIAGLPVPRTAQERSLLALPCGAPGGDWRKDWLYAYYEYPVAENVRLEALAANLQARLEELRRETRDSYRYTLSRTSFLVAQYGPPERPEPWRPNRS